MATAVDAGAASGDAATTVLMRARTPAVLVPEASRLTLTVSGAWEPTRGGDAAARSGRVVVVLPPGTGSAARPALVATQASHFSDADGGAGDFSYSVSWYNLTALPVGDALTVQAVTRGGRFRGLLAKLELAWLSLPGPFSDAPSLSPSPAALLLPSPSPAPAPSRAGSRPADEATTVVATPAPVHLAPGASGVEGGANITFYSLLDFTVPPGFNPADNHVDLWTRGEWVAAAGADNAGNAAASSPLGVVGVAHNGSLLAYAMASHYNNHAGGSANFSFGTKFG
jgi:hypothetical protein